MLMIDLFSGTGGASQAMQDAGWTTVRIDMSSSARPDVRADVNHLPLKRSLKPDLLWMSPPCTEFSDARPGPRDPPSMELVIACIRTIVDLRPRFWIIENVRGALPWLGLAPRSFGPFYLWGYFPPIGGQLRRGAKHTATVRSAKERGRIPYQLSNAVRLSIETYAGRCMPQRPTKQRRTLPQLFRYYEEDR